MEARKQGWQGEEEEERQRGDENGERSQCCVKKKSQGREERIEGRTEWTRLRRAVEVRNAGSKAGRQGRRMGGKEGAAGKRSERGQSLGWRKAECSDKEWERKKKGKHMGVKKERVALETLIFVML